MHLPVDTLLTVGSCGSGWCNKASRVSPGIDRGITGYCTPKIVYRKMIKIPRQLVEILLLIVLVNHVDLFERSSSPPERNIKWPKTGGS